MPSKRYSVKEKTRILEDYFANNTLSSIIDKYGCGKNYPRFLYMKFQKIGSLSNKKPIRKSKIWTRKLCLLLEKTVKSNRFLTLSQIKAEMEKKCKEKTIPSIESISRKLKILGFSKKKSCFKTYSE